MDPKPISKSIDADIIQCKADILRARQAAMAAQKGNRSAHLPGSPIGENAESELQPQGPDEGMQELLKMATDKSESSKSDGERIKVPSTGSLPAALRPLDQIRVGSQKPSKSTKSAESYSLNETKDEKSAFSPSNPAAARSFSEPEKIPIQAREAKAGPPSDSAPKKLRIPRFDEIVSWGKRILEDRPKIEKTNQSPVVEPSVEMNRLQQELEQVRTSRQELDGQVVRLQSELASMTHSLGRARDQLRENADTAERLYDQIEQLQKKDAEQAGQISDLRQQLSKKQAEIEEAIRNLQDSNQIQTQSQEQIQSLQNQLSLRNKDLGELQSRLSQIQTVLEQTQIQLQAEIKCRTELQSSQDQSAELNQRLQEMQTVRDQLQQQLADSEATVVDIRSQLEARQQELTWFRDELKSAQQLADQRQQQIDAFGKIAEERAAVRQLAETRQSRIHELEGQQEALKKRIDGLEKEIVLLKTESSGNRDLFDKQTQQLQEAHLESARLREQIQARLAAQSAVETELANSRQQILEGEQLRQNLQECLRELTDRCASVTKELEDARSQLDEVKTLWSQSESRNRKIQEESDRLLEELKQTRRELESVRLELNDVGSRQHGLEQQLQMESFLAEETESAFPDSGDSLLNVSQLESDMCRQLEPEGRMEWIPSSVPGASLSIRNDSTREAPADTVRRGASIPEFNLAEQILSEQRKVSAGRRQRSTELLRPSPGNAPRGIDHVVQSFSSSAQPVSQTVGPVMSRPMGSAWNQSTETLSPIQREILAEIVTAEIHRFYGR